MTEVFEVRLSPQQRRLWLLQEIHGPWNVEIEAELAGPLDRKALDAAILAAVERHDILRTTFQTIPGMKMPVQVIGEEGSLRVEVVPVGPDRHRLTLSLPVLCGDLGTLRLLLAAIADIAGRPVSEEPMQYWQYSEWLNELLEDESYAGERDSWQRRLTDPGETAAGGAARLEIDAGPLRDAAIAYGVSVQVFLLAAWTVLLQRHVSEGPEKVALGVVVDGREIEELAGSLGPFARALPLALPGRLDAPFAEVLAEVKETLADFAERQRYFAWESRSSLPFLFEYRSAAPAFDIAGARLTVLRETAPCDLSEVSLVCEEGLDRLVLDLQGAGGDLLARFATLLRSAAARPGRLAGDLDLLPAEERRRLLVDLNPPATLAAPDRCVHELFAAVAERTPDAEALVFGDRRLSYGELAARSRSLARRLRGLGVGPEVRVGLCTEIGPEAIVGILGIWEAGGAYVPVDPHGPAERRAFFLSDSGARIVVTQGALAADFAGERVVIDLDQPPDDRPDAGPLEGGAQLANLAYVLYTSGSTGVPKGVGVEHRQLAAYLAWVDQVLFGDRVRTCPWITPLTFDACLKQAVLPLLRGQAVWGFPGEATLDPPALLAELAGRDGAGINCTPTLWRALLEEIERNGATPGLSAVFLGGERLSPELFARTAAALPGVEIWNLYGPTETTANALVARLAPGDSVGDSVALGPPIDGARVYLLDPRMQPVPAGSAGEIHVGGRGAARGYLGRPDLTAERFVPDPFTGNGERLYRTGDLGRLGPDGQIEFLGRIDHQVKIRGFRIELGEIEARLELHPEVREAAVLVREDRLTAWVVPERGAVHASELRAALREALPEYMVPAAFVVLDRLPRLPSGKIDRAALPQAGAELASERPFVAPRTPAERLLADIWAEVLGRESVSVEDNFFELGGHSIQSIQISHRATAAGLAVTPRDLLHHPTIAGLAALAGHAAPADADWEEGSL